MNPEDAASTSFNLMVESDGIEYGCTNSGATNYDASANTDDGSCKLPVVTIEPEAKSSGGALGWLALGLLPLAYRRNRKTH